LLVGHRVKSSDEELKKLAGEFGQSDGDVVRHLGTCPVCQRSVTHGEFGVDHIMYYLEGDEEKAPRKVRSLPRLWCTPCVGRGVFSGREATATRAPFGRSSTGLEIGRDEGRRSTRVEERAPPLVGSARPPPAGQATRKAQQEALPPEPRGGNFSGGLGQLRQEGARGPGFGAVSDLDRCRSEFDEASVDARRGSAIKSTHVE